MRKLATGALSFSAAVYAANYIFARQWLPAVALAMLFAALVLVFFKRRWLLGFEIAFVSAALGFGVFYIHSGVTAVPASDMSGKEMEINAVLLDYPRVHEDYCSVYVRLTGDDAPHLKALLYDNDLVLANAKPGQHIRLTAAVKSADIRYGEEYDYYFSNNVYLILNSRSQIELIGRVQLLRSLPVRIKTYIASLIDELFPTDTAAFMRSLMLGDKSRLYDDTSLYTALSRAGFMHVAAVSGMHLAFLVGLIQILLGHTRESSLISILLLWIFVLVTGASPSAVRAGFMQSVLLMAPILRRENDPLTSLSTILSIVLLANPYAAKSVSLQLSFASIAGIMCFSSRIYNTLRAFFKCEHMGRAVRYVFSITSASLAVMVFTTPLMALHFGYISILSPIGNLLVMWAVSLCFCGGFICCAAGALVPIAGTVSAWLLSWAVRYIFLVARLISGIGFAAVYLDNPFMWCWFALSLIAVVIALITKMSAVARLVYPMFLCIILLVQANTLSRWYYSSGDGTMAVLDVGQGQSVACIGNDSAVLVDCGGNGSLDNAGQTAGAYLLSRGVHNLDALVLTHLHSDHVNGALMLMELVDVENIFIPFEPMDDEGYLEPILESAERHGSTVRYIDEDLLLTYGNLSLQLYKPADRGDTNERCIMCCLSLDEYDMLITADAPMPAENELVERHDFSQIEALVAGHHGSRYSGSKALMEEVGADIAIISVGYNNYGHPTYETLERLDAYGFQIYRTDLNKTVEIRP